MISSLSPQIRALILDMDGVLWRDDQPIVDLPKTFDAIRSQGLKFLMATNNAMRSVPQYLEKMAHFGVTLEPWQIVNSGMVVASLLAQQFPHGGPVYFIGENGLVEALKERGFYQSTDDALAVVVSMDRQINYAKLRQATFLIRRGKSFFGTNSDRTFPVPEGLAPGAGSILAAIEAATDVKPIVAGKPSAAMLKFAMDRLETPPGETLAVGDRLETDILGGYNAGCRTALVLSGVSTLEDLSHWTPQPDLVAPDLAALIGDNR